VDPEAGDLVAQRLRQTLERELRRAIGAEAGRRGLAADARHLHDGAAALTPHMGEDGTRQRGGREEVELEQEPELLVGGLLDRSHLRATGVVDEHVDAPEVLHRLLHRGSALPRVGDVERHDVDTLVLGEVGERLDPARGRDHPLAARQHGVGDRTTEAARAAGDHPHPFVHRR
jgi:hypothetical protein